MTVNNVTKIALSMSGVAGVSSAIGAPVLLRKQSISAGEDEWKLYSEYGRSACTFENSGEVYKGGKVIDTTKTVGEGLEVKFQKFNQ